MFKDIFKRKSHVVNKLISNAKHGEYKHNEHNYEDALNIAEDRIIMLKKYLACIKIENIRISERIELIENAAGFTLREKLYMASNSRNN